MELFQTPGVPFPNCSGTLIAPRIVLSARHCIAYGNKGTSYGTLDDFGIGDYQGDAGRFEFEFDGSWIEGPNHPAPNGTVLINAYSPQLTGPDTYDPDISTVTLQAPIKDVRPVALPASAAEEATLTAPGTPVLAAGYGLTADTGTVQTFAQRLSEAAMVAIPCPSGVSNSSVLDICAQPAPGPEFGGVPPGRPCFGDSGGPLLAYSAHRHELVEVGILSSSLVEPSGPYTCPAGSATEFYTNVGVQAGWLDSQLASPLPPGGRVEGPQIPPMVVTYNAKPFRPTRLVTRRPLVKVRRPMRRGGTLVLHSNEAGSIVFWQLLSAKKVAWCNEPGRRGVSRRKRCYEVLNGDPRIQITSAVTYLWLTGHDRSVAPIPAGTYQLYMVTRARNGGNSETSQLTGSISVR